MSYLNIVSSLLPMHFDSPATHNPDVVLFIKLSHTQHLNAANSEVHLALPVL